jgi:alkyldihydroxyacetonephosphate synthase
MKWWGWGDEKVTFTHADKPLLGPFVLEKIDIDLDRPSATIMDFDQLDIAQSTASPNLRAELEQALGADAIRDDALDRVVHAYGKSLRDLVRIRRGDLGRLPDLILYPTDEQQVSAILDAALSHDAVVIPFGGGTNISGSLEAPRGETRTVLSVDMGRMDQVLEIDETSQTARVQAGVRGPDLEQQLNARGWTIGHFPDSFNHSTLGGWIATRSWGMQSDM